MGDDMDEYLILKGSAADIASDLSMINLLAAQWWAGQGFTVRSGPLGPELIGKSEGVDRPDAAATIAWDEPMLAPSGFWYIVSPSNDPRFPAWKDMLANSGYALRSTEESVAPESLYPTDYLLGL